VELFLGFLLAPQSPLIVDSSLQVGNSTLVLWCQIVHGEQWPIFLPVLEVAAGLVLPLVVEGASFGGRSELDW
jgi:hypothetical protein